MHPRRPLAVTAVAGLVASLAAAGPVPTPDPNLVPDAAQEALGCDPIDPSLCLFPFPNDAFTVTDETTDTGRRVAFELSAMPRNGTDVTAAELGGEGKPVDPTEWNRNDGFSPGSPILTYVEGLDLHQTWGTADRGHSDAGPNEPGYYDHRDHIADVDLYREPNAPIVIIDASTGDRHPFWSELDSHPETTDDRRALILRPAENFREGGRYVVAMRHLKDAGGQTIEAGETFASYRDGEADDSRAAHFEELFAILAEAGIERDDLYLAWDFTVASERNLSERMLAIRDDAFTRILGDRDLGDGKVEGAAPSFVVDSTSERDDTWTDSRGVEHTQRVRRIEGRVSVPNYMDRPQQTEGHVQANQLPYDPPVPGSRFYVDPLADDDLPDQNPSSRRWRCRSCATSRSV